MKTWFIKKFNYLIININKDHLITRPAELNTGI
jgi:hypothetical protein